MDFSFSEEQRMLRDSVERYLDRHYSFEARRAIIDSRQGSVPAIWDALAELGLMALPVPEAHGGMGGTMVDLFPVLESFGRHLVLEPYLSTAVLGCSVLSLGGTALQQRELLPRLAAGRLRLAVAVGEPGSRYELQRVQTRARQEAGEWVLDGHKAVVLGAAVSDLMIVPARTSGAVDDAHGITLFLVDPSNSGVSGRDYPTYDGHRASEVSLQGVHVGPESVIGVLDQGLGVLEHAVDRAVAGLCAEAVGCMEALRVATLEYLKTRQQFGGPIGRFQVLQHRAVDMLIHCEQARSLALLAAVRADSDDAVERRRAVSAAKEMAGRAARYVGREAVQLHGGMGVTQELPASHHFRRLAALESLLGDTDHHLERFTQAQQAAATAPAQRPATRWREIA